MSLAILALESVSDHMAAGLTVVVDDGSHQLILLQHGKELQSFGLAQDVAALQALRASHQVIHLDPGPVVR